MVARGRGKKAASEAVAAIANGDVVPQENQVPSVSVEVGPPLAKKGRARGSKKEAKEEVEEAPAFEIAEKPAKVGKPSRGSKKTTKGKAVVEVDDVAPVQEEKNAKELEEDDAPLIETKPDVAAAVEKKTNSRKRKADSTEKSEEAPAPVAKKAPRTKTKGAKKETVDSAGVPEDPAASAAPVLAVAQTNGNKKSSSRKRAAPKTEEPVADEPIKEEEIIEPDEEIAPPAAKKSSKSKSSKKEPKKTSSKSKGSKKTAKEEDSPEDDILPEDEFVPEDEDEEPPQQQQQIEQIEPVEQPIKVKKIVKSKGSRKQLKDDIPPVEEEVASITEDEDIPGKQDSELDSAIEEEKKTKGKKSAKKASTKKATTKKSAKGKKATKDDPEPQAEIENELDTDIEPPEGKTNGKAKPKPELVEKKTALGGGGRKRAAATPDADETDGSKSAKPLVLLNPTQTEYKCNDFSLDKEFNLKISSWNIAGLRSWLKKDGLEYIQYEQPDIFCLQEIKCTTDQLPAEARIPGYHPYWLCMPGGHAGVAVYSKIMPINVEYGIGNAEHDNTGRMITAEYEKFYLICVYVPNSGMKLVNLEKRMQWEELFRAYVQLLDKVKPVIIAGDMNVSHMEIDLANPKTNTKNAGFTPQERDAMTKLLDLGYVDTFRHFYREKEGTYTFWSYRGKARSKNVGWRLDYFITSERITPKIVDSTIRAQVLGSDHCPIALFLNI